MRRMDDTEKLERLQLAERNMDRTLEVTDVVLYSAMSAMALSFYALRMDDPEKALEDRLKNTRRVTWKFSPSIVKWSRRPFLFQTELFVVDQDTRLEAFMLAQEYLDRISRLMFEDLDGDEAVEEIGLHIDFNLAAVCCTHDQSKRMFEKCDELARWALRYARDSCRFQEDRGTGTVIPCRPSCREPT